MATTKITPRPVPMQAAPELRAFLDDQLQRMAALLNSAAQLENETLPDGSLSDNVALLDAAANPFTGVLGAASLDVSGDSTLGGIISASGILTPTIAAQQNNYDIGTATVLAITLTGSQSITGFSGGTTGRLLLINLFDSVDSLTLVHESAASDGANRIPGVNNADVVLGPRGGALLIYLSGRWRYLATAV